jgi:hypothetical protein
MTVSVENAPALAALVSIGQSARRSGTSNHTKARIRAKAVGRFLNMSVIHAAFEPPCSLEATSPMIMGLLAAMSSTISW